MTASSRINSHTDLNRMHETRGNVTVEEGDLLVSEKTLTDKQSLITHCKTRMGYKAHMCILVSAQ